MIKEFFTPQIKRYEKILHFCKGSVLLDFGSSEGDLHWYLKKNFRGRVTGIDLHNSDILHNLNVFPYPFEENHADTIVAGEVIEHLLHPFKFLEECYRILKPDGVLIITTPNMIGLQHIVKPNNFWIKNREDPHIYAWNIEMIQKLMEMAGFKVIHKELLNTFWSRNLLFRGICFFFKKIRPTIFIVGKKLISSK